MDIPAPSQLIELFLADKDIAPISKRQYLSNLNLFFRWVKDQGKETPELRNADVIRYKELLIKHHRTPLTIANYMITLRLFYKWMQANDYGKDITGSIRINKSYNTFLKRSLSVEQSKHFLNQFETETLKGKRDYAIANLMLRNGLREIEVIRMNIEDIIEHNNTTAIAIQRKGKQTKNAFLPLSEKAMEAIHEYLAARPSNWGNTDPMFISLSNNSRNKRITTSHLSTMIKLKLKAAGIVGKMYTAHSLRHTAATLLIAEGYSTYEVKTFMGHANFETTQIYTRQKELDMVFNNNPTKLFDKLF